ncbi:hypothetical protein FOLKNPGA_02299 [Legionella sp. PC1000]|nr:hypothetical protein FOLKNPGA_02299 [Legionella sp. PC1000]
MDAKSLLIALIVHFKNSIILIINKTMRLITKLNCAEAK